MTKWLISVSLALFLASAATLGRAQSTPPGEERSPLQVSRDSLKLIADGYQLTEEQRQALYGLYAALMAISPGNEANQDQIPIINKDLLAIADDTSKRETGAIGNLARQIVSALLNALLPKDVRRKIAKDLWLILNMSKVNSASLSATADLCDTLEDGRLGRSELTTLRATIDTIITSHYKGDR